MSEKFRLLGVDPGIARTGFGVIDTWEDCVQHVAHGCLETDKNLSRQDRILDVYQQFQQIVNEYKPDLAGVEHLYAGRNATTAIQVAEARGAILLCLAQKGIPSRAYAPASIKLTLTESGRATKLEVREVVMMQLGLEKAPQPDDASDGLACALTTLYDYLENPDD